MIMPFKKASPPPNTTGRFLPDNMTAKDQQGFARRLFWNRDFRIITILINDRNTAIIFFIKQFFSMLQSFY
jgi:hypothetical protein